MRAFRSKYNVVMKYLCTETVKYRNVASSTYLMQLYLR